MKKIFIVALFALFANFCFAADDELTNDIAKKAIDIGFGAISGFLSGKSGDEIAEEAKEKTIKATKETANKKLDEATK
ncbi:hypothetical protein [Helicobacter sp.]|uniref:hypothetical protein n=1 Tax=Helicobacter sp. TaxID=218 RepID=UPI002588FDF1|nr:hypothetical protein [Helicobacter sp.]MCI7765144.1 hypothetical protein [Helicobacter sp.]